MIYDSTIIKNAECGKINKKIFKIQVNRLFNNLKTFLRHFLNLEHAPFSIAPKHKKLKIFITLLLFKRFLCSVVTS